jgi:hypothetical protein
MRLHVWHSVALLVLLALFACLANLITNIKQVPSLAR